MTLSFEAARKLTYFSRPHGESTTCPIVLCLCPVIQASSVPQGSRVSDCWCTVSVHESDLGMNEGSNLGYVSWCVSGERAHCLCLSSKPGGRWFLSPEPVHGWGGLTDTSLGAGEAPVLRHHVGIVALAG